MAIHRVHFGAVKVGRAGQFFSVETDFFQVIQQALKFSRLGDVFLALAHARLFPVI